MLVIALSDVNVERVYSLIEDEQNLMFSCKKDQNFLCIERNSLRVAGSLLGNDIK